MTASFDFDGTRLERYYHFVCLNDDPHLEMLAELGLKDKLHWRETRMGLFYRGVLHPWGNPLALLKFPGLSLLARLRYGLHIFVTSKRSNWRGLDRLEATAWLRRWIGEEAYSVLWKSLFELKFHKFSDQLSAAWIWSRIRRLGRSRYSLFREKLGYVEGGSDTLMTALTERLESMGVAVHLSSPVERVLMEDGRVRGLELAGGSQAFDAVVSTVPLPYVPSLLRDLPAAVLSQYESVESIAVACVVLKLRRSVSEYFWLNISDDSIDTPGVIEYTRLYDLGDHIVYAPYYLPQDHPLLQDSDQRFIDKVMGYLQQVNPALEASDLLHACVNRYRYAQPVCGPGFLDKLPPLSPGVEGLYVADTSYYYPHDRGVSESIELGTRIAAMIGAADKA
jgi:protoporphyrinogen oxidase